MRWLKPNLGWFKLKIDGSLKNFNMSCVGLIRDSNGQVVVTFVGPSTSAIVIMAEIQALQYGLQFFIYLGITKV